MKDKTLLIAILVGLLTFTSGWFLHSILRPSNQNYDTTKSINSLIDTASKTDKIKTNDLGHTILGHFILTKSNCAGFNFISNDLVLWTNEIACDDPDTLKIRWVSDSIFMTRNISQPAKNCPPRVDLYKVLSFDGKNLKLKSIWTGWNDGKDENLDLLKQNN